jgi:hypothetical protein
LNVNLTYKPYKDAVPQQILGTALAITLVEGEDFWPLALPQEHIVYSVEDLQSILNTILVFAGEENTDVWKFNFLEHSDPARKEN